jgi:hypothetical protein
MPVIDHFESKEEFLSFRDHVAKVMKHKNFGISLKQRNIDELAAMLAGAPDFNTALGLCKPKVPASVGTPPADQDPAKAYFLEQMGSLFYEISASLDTKVGGFCTTFDAVEYFESHLAHHSLIGVLSLIYAKGTQGQIALRAVARHAKDSNEAVRNILDECYSRNFAYTCSVQAEHVHSWLLNKQQYIIASWLDFLSGSSDSAKETASFAEYARDFSELCYHSGDNGANAQGEIEKFLDAAGEDFKLKAQGDMFQWSYKATIKSKTKSATKLDAIIDFLDQMALIVSGEHPQGKVIDPRLTHYIVAENGYWGKGATLLEAKRNRPYYGNRPLGEHALVYRCSPKAHINENGALTRPMEDPDAVLINPRTGKPLD